MSNRGRGGGTRTIANRAGCKRKKRQCELGTSCPYQHEYQHKLEYSHDLSIDSSAKAPRCGDRRKPKSTLSQLTSGAIKGTGSRGRLVAVASDRRRAERVAAQHGDQVPGDDPRASQRARWVTKMQEQLQQPRSAAENSGAVHARDGRCEERTQVSALEQVSSSSSGMGISRDGQEQRPRRQVEYIEILSDEEGEELSNTCNGDSSAASAVILQKPPLCNRSDAASEGSVQREGRRGRGVGEDDRGWHCESCTFRNSGRMDLFCAVCGIERVF